jgi:hypothetical protein
VLESNANDSLVALLLVATLLVLARPAARGAMLALTGLTKFAPFVLTPLMATYQARGRAVLRFGVGFLLAALIVMAQTIVDPGLSTFWHRTIASQIDRNSPFSVWGQVHGLEPLRIALICAIGLLAILVAFRPRQKSIAQLTALGAALLIGTQLFAQHWFYLYLVWFFPFLMVALATLTPEPASGPGRSTPLARSELPPPPPPSPIHPPQPSRSEPASA